MNTHIGFLKRKIGFRDIVSDMHYTVNHKGKFKWLQKFCLKVLMKYGNSCVAHIPIMECATVEYEKTVDLILNNIRDVERIEGLRCKYIVIGNRQMKELCNSDNFMYFQIPPDADLRRNQRTFLGMNIILVPWIDGVFCLPELY
jgi:hypothetical protein